MPTFDELTTTLRSGRGFVVDEVVGAKVGRLVRWFRENEIDAAVVGLSGGVDSAAVLGLLELVRGTSGSPLRRVVAAVVPIEGPGATGQSAAADRASLVADQFGSEVWRCPLGDVHSTLLASLSQASGIAFDEWSAGQMLSVERTPVLYGAVALLGTAGHRGVVVGTTNRDEGAYLGFFGKASDGAVDLQPISDLHKSEVRLVARALGVPQAVLDAAPSGDVHDGRTDAEMIGVEYDDVEVVLRLRELALVPRVVSGSLDDGDRLARADAAVERLHTTNRHKYRVGSPAVHLDVLPRGVPDGWTDEVVSGRHEVAPVVLPGRWEPPPIEFGAAGGLPRIERTATATIGRGAVTDHECALLEQALRGAPGEDVGVSGVVAAAGDPAYGVGSRRSTAFSPELASQIWRRIAPLASSVRFLGPSDPTDGHATDDRDGHRTWRVVGLSPLLRFMRYGTGGHHLCHYDAGFDYGDGRRTLASVVLFLTDAGSAAGAGGSLRFIDDGQSHLPVAGRDHGDWGRSARPDEIIAAIAPERGTAVVFDHRRAHDVETWSGSCDRIVLRADVVYERIPDGRGLG